MRSLSLALVLVACGGSTPPPASRPPVDPPVAESRPSPDPTPEPTTPEPAPSPAPAPPPPPRKPVGERLRDDSGDVPGLAGWKVTRKADPNHCSGLAITTTRGKSKASADDQPLVDVYALTFPTGLNFAPGEKNTKRREASLKKFNDFVAQMTKVGGDTRAFYEGWITDEKRDAQAKIVATARIAQTYMRLASVLARAEIPKDVRTGEFAAEKIEAFCSRLSEVAEPLAAQAEQAMQVCADKSDAGRTRSTPEGSAKVIDKSAKHQLTTGWWAAVCMTK